MKKLIILTGDQEDKAAVKEVLIKNKIAKPISLYDRFEDILSQTFDRMVSRSKVVKVDIEIKESHLRKFFGKMQRGIRSLTHFVGKKITSSSDLVDYFVNKVGSFSYGEDFLVKDLIVNYEILPQGIYVLTDADDSQISKISALLPRDVTIVQILKSQEDVKEGSNFFVLDRSRKSWEKAVKQMFETVGKTIQEKETTNG